MVTKRAIARESSQVTDGASRVSGRRVSFVMHEVAEYIVAAALVAVGFHVSGAAQLLLVAVGAVMLVLGACSTGRLGAFDLLSRRAHHAGDGILIVVLALSPIVLHAELHLAGIVLAELVALVLLRIERGTIYDEAPPSRRRARLDSSLGAAAPPVGTSSVGTEPAARLGAVAAVAASSAATAASQLAPVAGRAARVGIRSVGLVAGAAKRVARERNAARPPSGP